MLYFMLRHIFCPLFTFCKYRNGYGYCFSWIVVINCTEDYYLCMSGDETYPRQKKIHRYIFYTVFLKWKSWLQNCINALCRLVFSVCHVMWCEVSIIVFYCHWRFRVERPPEMVMIGWPRSMHKMRRRYKLVVSTTDSCKHKYKMYLKERND